MPPTKVLVLTLLGSIGWMTPTTSAIPTAAEKTGEQIYKDACVRCHGAAGEGVAGKSDEPLHGTRAIPSLAKLIQKTMPEDEPGTLKQDEAEKVAAYIHGAFYSPEARLKMHTAKVEPSRLTITQYRNSVADLFLALRNASVTHPDPGGLRAQYFASRNFRGLAMIERTDPSVHFTFEGGSPDMEIIPNDEFSARWRGSLLAEETGGYEISLKTENGARLWLNNDNKTLIDAWVSSGAEPREHRAVVYLLGGRAYPLRVDLFRFKEKTASVSLQWRPPLGVLEPIPARHLSPESSPPTLVVSTPFPADDSSVGYERGTSVSKAWDHATTSAAVEVANKVLEQLDELTGSNAKSSERKEKLQSFCAKLAERAFRRPLTADEKQRFAEAPFADAKDPETGVKRAVLLILKSPRFLYPDLIHVGAASAAANTQTPAAEAAPTQRITSAYATANRLALSLWDSIPDTALLTAASEGKLATPEQIATQAKRMLNDPRAKSKVRGFLHHWLEMEEGEDVSKDPKAYPDFNQAVLADLRTSLETFLDSVIWSDASDYRQLLLADYLYLNDRLATFYGIAQPTSASIPSPGTPGEGQGEGRAPDFKKVSFNPTQRTGVLTHPFLLTALAYHKNSSPIHRGVFLTRNIVGGTLKPPPAAIEFMDDRFDPSLTMREKVAELTRPAACQSCHSVINPLGFSLEHYDAVGRFRTIDNNKPVDATSEYPTHDGKSIKVTGPRDVAEYAAKSPEAHRAFIRQLFNHLTKQQPESYSPKALDQLHESFTKNQFNVQKLIVEIVSKTAPFEVQSAYP